MWRDVGVVFLVMNLNGWWVLYGSGWLGDRRVGEWIGI